MINGEWHPHAQKQSSTKDKELEEHETLYALQTKHNFLMGGILLISVWFCNFEQLKQVKLTWPVIQPGIQLQACTKLGAYDIFPLAYLHKWLIHIKRKISFLLYSAENITQKNAFMAFSNFSNQKIAICIQGLVFIPCIHYGTLAHSKERLSHYCANDMPLLEEHFERAE